MSQSFFCPWRLSQAFLGLVLLAFLARTPPAAAQTPAPAADSGSTRHYPYAMPEVPALTFIDAGSPKISRPVTPRALATELVNAIDTAGRVQQGLAIAVAPAALLGKAVTLADYQHNYGQYLISNAQVSLGTVRVAGTTGATDLGLGLRLTLFDGSDPMRSTTYTDSVRALLLQALPKYAPPDTARTNAIMARLQRRLTRAQQVADSLQKLAQAATGAGAAQANNRAAQAASAVSSAAAQLTTAQAQLTQLSRQQTSDAKVSQALPARLARHRQRWNNTHWNAASLTVAGATGWRLTDSRLAPAPTNGQLGWSAWATGGLPLGGTAGLLLGQVRYTYARQVPALTTLTQSRGQLLYGARAVFGSANLNFYLELTGTNYSNPLPGTTRSRSDWGGGVEFKTIEGMWLATGFGHRFSNGEGPAEAPLLFAGLRWQLASAARFAPAH
ncbi:MAG: hypothetical protein ACRYFX_18225 [Janthinobacterium lividum]